MEVILTGRAVVRAARHELGLVNRLCEPRGVARHCDRPRRADLPLARRWRSRESRKIVLAADYEDDETLKKMTNEAMANVMGVRGPEGRARGVHREARPELDGSLTSTAPSR